MEIPSLSISDNKIVLETKEIPLIVNEAEVKITIQKLPAGKKREIIKSNAQTKIVGQQVSGNIDSVGYQISLLTNVIIKAPFTIDELTISSLPSEVLDYLFEEYDTWATPKKKV